MRKEFTPLVVTTLIVSLVISEGLKPLLQGGIKI